MAMSFIEYLLGNIKALHLPLLKRIESEIPLTQLNGDTANKLSVAGLLNEIGSLCFVNALHNLSLFFATALLTKLDDGSIIKAYSYLASKKDMGNLKRFYESINQLPPQRKGIILTSIANKLLTGLWSPQVKLFFAQNAAFLTNSKEAEKRAGWTLDFF